MKPKASFDTEYAAMLPTAQRCLEVMKGTIRELLDNRDIPYFGIEGRLKSLESARDKMDRKIYSDPIRQLPDLIGLRVITYFEDDLGPVTTALAEDLEVLSHEDVKQRLLDNQFGYRSDHQILRFKSSWCDIPPYRGLQNIQVEVQVRTLLMHAWSEVSHKISYKNDLKLDSKFDRILSTISAKLEEIDDQFVILRKRSAELHDEAQHSLASDIENTESNLSHALLRVTLLREMPNRAEASDESYISILNELKELKVSTVSNLVSLIDLSMKAALLYEQDYPPANSTDGRYNNVGLLRAMLYIMYDNSFIKFQAEQSDSVADLVVYENEYAEFRQYLQKQKMSQPPTSGLK